MTTPYYSAYTGVQVDAAVAAVQLSYSGTWDIGNGEETGTVTGLGLPFLHTSIQLTMEIPADGYMIYPNLIGGTLSEDGFTFQLTAPTNNTNYRLHYTLKGDSLAGSSS